MNDENVNIIPEKTDKKRVKLFFFIALAISAVAVILRSISLLFFYDSEIAYYTSGAVLPMISNIFYVAAVLFFVLAAYLLVKPVKGVSAPVRANSIVMLIPGVVSVLHAAVLLIDISKTLMREVGGAGVDRIAIIATVTAIASAAFFFFVAFSKKHNMATAILSIGFMAWCGVAWVRSYMNFDVPLNSPDKLLFHFGIIAAALFLVAELRTMFEISKPKFYYFSLFTAMLALSVATIPSIIGNAAGVFKIYAPEYENYVLFGLLLYVVARGITIVIKDRLSKYSEQADPQE